MHCENIEWLCGKGLKLPVRAIRALDGFKQWKHALERYYGY